MRISMNIQRQIARYSVPIVVGLFIVFQVWKIKSTKPVFTFNYDTTINEPTAISMRFSSTLQRRGRSVATLVDNSTNLKQYSNTTQHHYSFTTTTVIHFPHGNAVRPMKQILSALWVPELQLELTKLTDNPQLINKQVSVVVSDVKYKASLLNWLVAALVHTNPPISNVIVISLDGLLRDFLQNINIPSVYVDSKTVIRPGTRMQSEHSHIWITRCVIYRLLNYWGYDVVVYDTDAIVLKNLQPIFDAHQDSDIIGSIGSYPFQLGREWGQTFCMGVAFFRSTQRTDMLWEAMSHTRRDTFDDQVKLNYALHYCHIEWQSRDTHTSDQAITGQCAHNLLGGLKVTILPESTICRRCQNDHGYYVWHNMSKKTAKAKLNKARQGKVWYLKEHWDNSRDNHKLTGLDWLRTISKS